MMSCLSMQDPFDCTESSSARAWPKGNDVQPNVSCIEDSQTQFLDAQGWVGLHISVRMQVIQRGVLGEGEECAWGGGGVRLKGHFSPHT